MLTANGLSPVKAPTDVPSEGLFGDKMVKGIKGAMSKESIASVISGFQEEGFDEMLKIQERDSRRKQQRSAESIYSREKRAIFGGRSCGRENSTTLGGGDWNRSRSGGTKETKGKKRKEDTRD